MEDEYDSELKKGVGNDLVKEMHYDFASINFLETFYPQMIAQDFWSIIQQRSKCKEGDINARISYNSLRRYLRKTYAMVTDSDIDTLYQIVMPNVRRSRVAIDDLKSERIDLMTFIRITYLFYRFYDILHDPHIWIFYFADTFYNGYASLLGIQALTAFTYQLDKKDMRYLFRVIQSTAGWMGIDQWQVLSEGLECIGKARKNTSVYINQEKRAAILRRNREKTMADDDLLKKDVEHAIETPNESAVDTVLEQHKDVAAFTRKNLDILNKRALLLAQGVSEADVMRLLKMSPGQINTNSLNVPAPPAMHLYEDAWVSSNNSKVHSVHESPTKVPEDQENVRAPIETEVVGVARMVLTPIKEGGSTRT